MSDAAWIAQINLSDGGVPKLPVHCATVTALGLEGDRQNDLAHHGGPDRALCLYALECLTALQLEGHPIFAGATGENLTLGGLDWALIVPGVRLRLGDEVIVEITQYASPCQKIASSFAGAEVARMSQERHPGWARVYARVLAEGHIRIGDRVHLDTAARPTSENTGTGRSA
jgi:MOSC domain-containing protein YiiM